MKIFLQYHEDLQDYANILLELNEQGRKLADFEKSLGLIKHEPDYWSRIVTAEQLEERRRLFIEEQALDARWNKTIRELIQKGYTSQQLPTREDMDNYVFIKDFFQKRAG